MKSLPLWEPCPLERPYVEFAHTGAHLLESYSHQKAKPLWKLYFHTILEVHQAYSCHHKDTVVGRECLINPENFTSSALHEGQAVLYL